MPRKGWTSFLKNCHLRLKTYFRCHFLFKIDWKYLSFRICIDKNYIRVFQSYQIHITIQDHYKRSIDLQKIYTRLIQDLYKIFSSLYHIKRLDGPLPTWYSEELYYKLYKYHIICISKFHVKLCIPVWKLEVVERNLIGFIFADGVRACDFQVVVAVAVWMVPWYTRGHSAKCGAWSISTTRG